MKKKRNNKKKINKKLSHEERVYRSILIDNKLKRVPQWDNRPRPAVFYCGRCKKNKVIDHHWLCNKCWKDKKEKEN